MILAIISVYQKGGVRSQKTEVRRFKSILTPDYWLSSFGVLSVDEEALPP